jgi:hypothetical protein
VVYDIDCFLKYFFFKKFIKIIYFFIIFDINTSKYTKKI